MDWSSLIDFQTAPKSTNNLNYWAEYTKGVLGANISYTAGSGRGGHSSRHRRGDGPQHGH